MFSYTPKSISFFQDTVKQIKLSNKISNNFSASLGTLVYWAESAKVAKDKKTALLLNSDFLNIYPYFSSSFSSSNNSKFVSILNFKILTVLFIQCILYYKGLIHNKTKYFNTNLLLKPTYSLSYFFYNLDFAFFAYNTSVLTWSDLNKQLFNSSFLTLTFKTTKRNIFLIISSASGSILWKKSAGVVGFSGKHKKAPEALRKLVDSLLIFLRSCNVTASFIFRFFFVKSLDKNKLDSLVGLLNRLEIYYTYIIYDVRQPHGYMRLRKQRRL